MFPTLKWLNSTSNKLFTIDTDTYTLFRLVDKKKDKDDGQQQLIVNQVNSRPASLPIAKQEQETVRSFALDHSVDNYVALGFTSGRISIFPADIEASSKFVRGEDIREVQKSITHLEWNYFDSNRLCAAYERGRGPDHTVVIYDLNRTPRNARELPVSIFEVNLPEKVFGISWFREDPNLLLISGTHSIKITDIREHGNFQSTFAVQNPLIGVCSEPINGYLFASHSRNSIHIYDRRFLTYSSLYEIEACAPNKIINKLGWHPKRNFHLSATAKDSGNFYYFSISTNVFQQQQAQNSEAFFQMQQDFRKEQPEYSYGIHLYSVPGHPKLGSFDWHPHNPQLVAFLSAPQLSSNRIIYSYSKDPIIINLREDVSSDISCNGQLAYAAAQSLKIESSKLPQPNRIQIFKTRISNGYGYGNSLTPVSTLIENSKRAIEQDEDADDGLRICWQWIWTMYQSADAHEIQKAHGTIFAGIKHILRGSKSNSTIKQDEITFRNRIFVNDRRLKILKICNWPNYSDREECKTKFDELANRMGGLRGITRAAALALFSVQGALCKEYLIRLNEFVHSREFVESEQSLELVTCYQKMADIVLDVIQKYDGVRVPDYENVCNALVSDDYLLTIVKFLARRDKIYNKIYNEIFESKIDLEDKLAFAALHMDDDFLTAALNKLIRELLQTRPLSVLLIVGLEDQPESHQLINHYLDITEDIQTASILLVIGNCFRRCPSMQDFSLIGAKPSDLLERAIESESRANPRRRSLQCIRDYVGLLNRWRLWIPKTFLCTFLRPRVQHNDIDLRSRVSNIQAVIACTYCGSPIYPSLAEKIENLRTPKISSYPRRTGTTSRTRTISCICRKPLPKCIICRRHLGSQIEPEMNFDGNVQKEMATTTMIDHWFVWCSSCNHGGHLAHIRDWFNEYPICASAGCECFCIQRDPHMKDELMHN